MRPRDTLLPFHMGSSFRTFNATSEVRERLCNFGTGRRKILYAGPGLQDRPSRDDLKVVYDRCFEAPHQVRATLLTRKLSAASTTPKTIA